MAKLNLQVVHGTNEGLDEKAANENSSELKNVFLKDFGIHDISRVFVDFGKENRTVIMPVGFPSAGKSLLISSLMFNARTCPNALFTTNLINGFPFNGGRIAVDQMIRDFQSGKLYAQTSGGALDLIGIHIEPTNKKAKLPLLKLAFLDLAGEDLQKIKTTEGATFTAKINAVFNGLKVDNSPIVFVLITPFEPSKLSGESLKDAHHREDALHYDFLNYIKMDQPQLLINSRFFVVVSQWDKNTNKNLKVEDFIKENRPSIYNYVQNTNVIWGEYSIGQLLTTTENSVMISEIVRINHEYPYRFWKKLYQICTNQDLDKKTWWNKITG